MKNHEITEFYCISNDCTWLGDGRYCVPLGDVAGSYG